MTTTLPNVTLEGHYSMTAAAALLGVDRKTIYRWRKAGYIKEKQYRHCSNSYITGREILKIYGTCS